MSVMKHKLGNQSNARRLYRGFTLIEILVVLAIITVLAAILFPVFGRARENARRTTCMSNLKQIATASQLYLQDSDRRYPPFPPPEDDDGNVGWAWELRKLLQSDQIFQCPSEPLSADAVDSDGLLIGGFTDYWMNYNLEGKFEGRIQFPANTILLGDGDGDAINYSLPTVAFYDWDPAADYAQRHFDGSNYAFADGHVKWLKPSQISLTDNPTGTNFTFVP